jgi:hypothetical protein
MPAGDRHGPWDEVYTAGGCWEFDGGADDVEWDVEELGDEAYEEGYEFDAWLAGMHGEFYRRRPGTPAVWHGDADAPTRDVYSTLLCAPGNEDPHVR